ncbi:MAG: hypothetical protein V7605_1776, partial [Acidimicrobiaceae bacterium]
MDVALRILVFVAGAVAVLGTVGSAVRTVVLPRGIPAKLSGAVFLITRILFRARLRRTSTYERRDSVMAGYAPTALLSLVSVWLSITLAGYTAMFWALGARPLR